MASSLGLVGDLDDVELIEDIEAAFALRLSDDDLKQCRTVGDVFQLIERSLPTNAAGGSCATSMCFYRLRRALRRKIDFELRPETPIEDLKFIPVRQLYRIIERDCGLRPPPQFISVWGCIGLSLAGALPIASLILGLPWWLCGACVLPGIAIYRMAPIRLPPDLTTFGDLVRKVAARSMGPLSAKGARLRPPEAWTALKDIAADHCVLPKEQITSDTLILAPTKAAS